MLGFIEPPIFRLVLDADGLVCGRFAADGLVSGRFAADGRHSKPARDPRDSLRADLSSDGAPVACQLHRVRAEPGSSPVALDFSRSVGRGAAPDLAAADADFD
jgi:uncharacterized protein with von Willebrand factor type A (vWA) domain